ALVVARRLPAGSKTNPTAASMFFFSSSASVSFQPSRGLRVCKSQNLVSGTVAPSARVLPSGKNPAPFAFAGGPSSGPAPCPARAPQPPPRPPAASRVTTYLPSGDSATPASGASGPCFGDSSASFVRSQTRTVLSAAADTTWRTSGE